MMPEEPALSGAAVTAAHWVAGLARVAAEAASAQSLVDIAERRALAARAHLAATTSLRTGQVAAGAVLAHLAGGADAVEIADPAAGVGGAARPVGAVAVTHTRAVRAHLARGATVVDVAAA